MWKKNKLVRAVTLLEVLVSLLVLSGGVLIFKGLTSLLSHEISAQSQSRDKEWLVFTGQLRAELDGMRLDKVDANRLYVHNASQSFAFGQSKSDDFRKTNQKGQGYQPMLYHVTSSSITQDGEMVVIRVTMDDGTERTFHYAFEERS